MKVKLPPYSPDINVIELVWAELKRFLRKKTLRTRQEVANRIHLFFDKHLSQEKCRNYINHVHGV
jgi:transposase